MNKYVLIAALLSLSFSAEGMLRRASVGFLHRAFADHAGDPTGRCCYNALASESNVLRKKNTRFSQKIATLEERIVDLEDEVEYFKYRLASYGIDEVEDVEGAEDEE